MVEPMTSEQLEAWQEDLINNTRRKQATGRLVRETVPGTKEFCCLGVYADLNGMLDKHGGVEDRGMRESGTNHSALPRVVFKNVVAIDGALDDELTVMSQLMFLNDQGRLTLPEIGAWIRDNLNVAEAFDD